MRTVAPSLMQDQLQPFIVGLSDLKAVKSATENLMTKEGRLSILVNNAGLLGQPLDKASNGISVSFNTNHLGPFVLTIALLPLLEKTATLSPGVRVMMVSSYTHEAPPRGIRFASFEDFNAELGRTDDPASNYACYGLSKLANILFAKSLQKYFIEKGIPAIVVSLHPGDVRTAGSFKLVGENVSLLDEAREPVDGAMTSLFAATSSRIWEERERFGAGYLMPFWVVVEESENARDDGWRRNNRERVRGLLRMF